jgi:hypothetical protein
MFVVPAGIAGTQTPGKACKHYIHVIWIPAIHAGMALLLKDLYNQVTFYQLLIAGQVTNPHYDFNNGILPVGAAIRSSWLK